MAKPWSEVAASEGFKSLSDAEKEIARQQYFEQVVAPRVPKEDIGLAREQFLSQTAIATPQKERTYGEVAKDIAASGISGAGALVQLPGQLYGLATGDFSDTGALKAGKELQKYGESLKSEQLKGKEAARAAKIKEAAKEGQVSAGVTAFMETIKDPTLLTSFIAEQAPNLLPGMAVARGLKMAGMGAHAVKGAIGTGAVQQGADVGAESFIELQKMLVAKGVPPEEATGQALAYARKVGAAASVISIVAQNLPGGKSIEKALAGVPSAAKKGVVGKAAAAGKAGLGESVGEMLEEGGGKVAQNLAAQQVDPNRKLTEGLGETMGMAAVGGMGLGTAAGLAQRRATEAPSAEPAPVPEPAAPAQPAAQAPTPQPAAPTQQAAQPQPPADPRRETLVQTYVKEGMAPDDAAILADQELAALTTPPEQAVQASAQAQQAAVQQAIQEVQNVPSPQQAAAGAEPVAGQPSPEVPSGTEQPAGGIAPAIQRGLAAASSVAGQPTGGEELQRAPVDALSSEFPTYEAAQAFLNANFNPQQVQVLETDYGYVVVPRREEAAQTITEEPSVAEAPQAVEAETEGPTEPAAEPAAPAVEEAAAEEEAVAEEAAVEEPVGELTQEEVDDAFTPEEDVDAGITAGEDAQRNIEEAEKRPKTEEERKAQSAAINQLNRDTQAQIELADKLIQKLGSIKKVINFADQYTDYKNFGNIEAVRNDTIGKLTSLLDYFQEFANKEGNTAAHKAVRDYLAKLDAEIEARKAVESRKQGRIGTEAATGKPDTTFKQFNTAVEAVTHIARTGTDTERVLAAYLLQGNNLKMLRNVEFVVVNRTDKIPDGNAKKDLNTDSRGLYVLYEDGAAAIYVRGETYGARHGIDAETVLHEAFHAVGNQKINLVKLAEKYDLDVEPELKEAVYDLTALMDQARETYDQLAAAGQTTPELESLYNNDAFTDVSEFYSYGMTDADMKKFLRDEVPGESPNKSGFNNFVDFLLKLFGVNPKYRTALKDLVLISNKISKAAAPDTAQVAALLVKENAKLSSKAKDVKKKSEEAERKLEAARRHSQVIEDTGSLMKVAKNPELWSDYFTVNYRNVSTAAFKGYLAAAPTNVVIDIGESLGIGSLEDVNAGVQRMQAYRIQRLQQVQDLAVPWIKLDEKTQQKLADVMHYATDVQIDPAKTSGKDAKLDRMWNALPVDAKAVYTKVRDYYKNNYNLYRALLAKRVQESGVQGAERDNLMAQIKQTYEAGAKMEPYFPFMRYGDYWAKIGKGTDTEFHMFESAGQRDLFLERVAKERNMKGDNRTLAEMMEAEDIKAGNDVESLRSDAAEASGALKKLFTAIDGITTTDAKDKARLKDEVFQIHLLTLPEASFRKQFIHRKGTAGFSGDALRNFVTAGTRFSNQISKIKYGQNITTALAAAKDSLAGNPDQARLGMVVRELELRVKDELEPTHEDNFLDKVARTSNKAAFIWMLTSVKSAANQLFSVLSFTAPTLAKYHGWGATAAEMAKFIPLWQQIGTTRTDRNGNVTFIPSVSMAHAKGLTADERRAFQIMVDRGVSDATRTYDLALRKGVPSANYNDKMSRVVNAMGTLFHATERLSREIAFMSAFRLEFKKTKDFDASVNKAMHIVNESLFDYSAWNAPRVIRSAPARIVTQFMKFPLFVTIYLARNFRAIIKPMDGETRAGAFKAFAGTMGMTAALAGTAGLPMYSAVFGVLQALRNALRDDDEEVYLEEENLEAWFRKVWLPKMFGEVTIAGRGLDEIIDTGLLDAITGFKFSDGLSLNNMWNRDAPDASTWKDAYGQTVTSFLGPGVGLGQSWATAIDDINKGDMLKGLEKLTPALFRGAVTDLRFATEGAVAATGDVIKYSDEFTNAQLLMQALGYKTTGLAERMNELYLIKREEKKVKEQRNSLINALNHAATMERDADFEAVEDKIDEFNMKYPQEDLRIDYEDKRRALERRRKMLAKSERGYAPDDRFRDLEILQEPSLKKIEREAAK